MIYLLVIEQYYPRQKIDKICAVVSMLVCVGFMIFLNLPLLLII